MEPEYLNYLVKNELQNSGTVDINSPLSFLEWKGHFPTIHENNALEQYNAYVINWFAKHRGKPVSAKFVLRQKYLYMLDQLQLFFSDKEKHSWYNQINLADEKELLLAIPYFAKRLKEISLYYLNLRKKVKNAKVKYNAVGSVGGLEQEIYTYLLENFALSGNNLELIPSVQQTIPNFPDLQKTLSVRLEELYDDKQYFDISPSQPLTTYYNFLHESTAEFLSTKGITLSSADWLFNSFDVSTELDNFATTIEQLTGVLFELTDTATYTNFIQKYIAENKYITSYVPRLTTTSTIDVVLAQGNNYFYYPYGTTSSTFSINQILPQVPLSSLYIEGATAGLLPADSDTIIVKHGKKLKAAWLRNVDYIDVPKTVKATIKRDNSTFFIFPYPGYGLSAADVPWTGPSFETNPEYNFLTIENKSSVNQAYWSQTLSNDTCNSILLNNTTLVSCGATPNIDPRYADHFYIRTERNPDTSIPRGETTGAWLYKFTKTALPISTIDPNIILWPYTRIDINDVYPSHLQRLDFTAACNSVSIQDLPTSHFVAASSIELADKIYKINNYADSTIDALECVWLSGADISLTDYNTVFENGIINFNKGNVNGYRYVNQDGFAALMNSGEPVRFMWTGPVVNDKYGNTVGTSLEEVFTTISHKRDCPFVTNMPTTLPQEWEKCTCKQVYHTPFGTSTKTFAQGNYFADCIFEVSDRELASFDFGSWRDKYGRTLDQGGAFTKFAWYRTKTSSTWGNGKWVTDSGQIPFKLMPGKCYIYVRANSKTSDTSFPPYAVTYSFKTKRTKWIEAKRSDTDGEWVSTGREALTKLYPGDLLNIERRTTYSHELLSAIYIENIPANQKSIWSTYDNVPINCESINVIDISWPKTPKPFKSTDPQYPPFDFTDLARVEAWSIERIEDGEIQYYVNPTKQSTLNSFTSATLVIPNYNSQIDPDLYSGTYSINLSGNYATNNNALFDSVTFIPPVTGTYAIAVTATNTKGVTVQINSSTIPLISCIPQYQTKTYTSIPFETATCGFLLEKTLYGWNYGKNKVDIYAEGARPYWAVLDIDKDSTTRYKSVYSWGYPDNYVDAYVPDTSPIISPIEINFGSVVQCDHKGSFFVWNQPIAYREYSGTTQWCNLSVDFTYKSNLSSFYDIKKRIEPTSVPGITPSDITLSNFVDGEPLEVFYYAMSPLTWAVQYNTVMPQETSSLSSYYIADAPWENLTNRFNPTIANIPVLEETYSLEEVGGYFLPQNLGATQFLNKNYNVFVKSNALTGTTITEDISVHVGGRGITKQDNPSIFDWTEDNQWLKEPIVAGDLAGAIKKSLTKSMQTFIPYQSNIEETSLGLINSYTKFSPWGGSENNEWIDSTFDPKSFTGVRSVSAWSLMQTIREAKKDIGSWTTDIYGNQYGLFKEVTNIPFHEQKNIGGELWVKLNNQQTKLGTQVLSTIYKSFKGFESSETYEGFYNKQIQSVECYFDTLFIQTPNIIFFAKLLFDYELQTINSIFDDTRWITLTEDIRFEKNWFFPAEKKIITLVTRFKTTDNNIAFYPCLWELDLNTRKFTEIFKLETDQIQTIYFSGRLDCSFSYNSGRNLFLISYSGINKTSNTLFVVDYYITKDNASKLFKWSLYEDKFNPALVNTPPKIVAPYSSLSTQVTGNVSFTINLPVLNSPTQVNLLNYTKLVLPSISNNGQNITFTGTLSAGLYHVNYMLKNNIGESIYCLTLSAI